MNILLLLLSACSSTPDRVPQEVASARAYCELSADAFCDYYQRCDRMAEDTHAACRDTFIETCEGVYEPRYAALEDRGDLALSATGLATCAEHLRTVDCEVQINDLDGACGDVWAGQVGEGGSCGLGIESFVCDADTTCILGLDFCGTCQATVPVGSGCEPGIRCTDDATCVDGTCVLDAQVGEACSDSQPCRLGAQCTDGTCTSYATVGLGEACDSSNRCQYRAACVGGVCEQTPLLGEECTPRLPCASGWCDSGTCAPLREEGEACDGGNECLAGVCDEGACGPLTSACLND